MCRRDLAAFMRYGWSVIDPAPLEWNWHLDALCEHLMAVTRGDLLRLVINVPPGTCKSLAVSVFWPAWEWITTARTGGGPHIRSQFGSYDDGLAMRDAVRCRDLISSDWFQRTFDPPWRLKNDQNTKHDFANTARGFRRAFNMGGRVTGHRGDKVVLDDPLNARDQHNRRVKDQCLALFDGVLSTRVNDPRKARFVVIMQRLADDDLAGHLAKRKGYEMLVLPAEYEPNHPYIVGNASEGIRPRPETSIGFRDPRGMTLPERRKKWPNRKTYWFVDEGKGGLLDAKRLTRRVLDDFRNENLGFSGYAGQYQQRPMADEGGLFKKAWIRRYEWVGHDAVKLHKWEYDHEGEQVSYRAQVIRLAHCTCFGVVDPAAGEKQINDPSGCGYFAKTRDGDLLLLDYWSERLESPDLLVRLQEEFVEWLRPPFRLTHYVIESQGIGLPIVQAARREKHLPVVAFPANNDKVSKSVTARVRMQAGQIFLPYEEPRPNLAAEPGDREVADVPDWIAPFVKELTLFPNAEHDEAVDVLSMAAIAVFNAPPDYADAAGVPTAAKGVMGGPPVPRNRSNAAKRMRGS